MTEKIPPRERWILHFTHLDNVPAIVAKGALVCDVTAREGLNREEVGDPEIKDIRRRRAIPVGPGGTVGGYVPFYLAPRSPMMYRIACDHRDGTPGRYPGGDRPLLYLATALGAVIDAGLAWVGTDGNAATATTAFTTDLDRFDEMVDWPLMTATRWNNTPDDPDRQRRRMAEVLVHTAVPLSVIHQVAAYGEPEARLARAAFAGHELAGRVVVRPGWYYGYERREAGRD